MNATRVNATRVNATRKNAARVLAARVLAALSALVLTVSDAPPAAAHGRPAVRADTLIDTVFVASNRRRVAHGFTRDVSDSLWYGLYVTRTVVSSEGDRALQRMKVTRLDSAALDASVWRTRLRAAVRDTSARSAALVYVHGYSSAPGTALAQGVQVRARGAHRGPLVLFLWPTHERYVTPPTPARAYNDDARAAARSGPALARVMTAVDEAAPSAVLVAHSMGTRVAMDALLTDTVNAARYAARPLRAIGIFSPDVGAERFRAEFARRLPLIAHRVALYGASTDYLLGASAMLNRERRASGITRRGEALHGIELVDATRGARAEPVLLTWFGPRHAVRWASAALADFFSVAVSDAPSSCRVTVGTADAEGDGRWRLRRRVMPNGWLSSQCETLIETLPETTTEGAPR